MESKRILVAGRVQGVGYRYFIVKKATEMNLLGYVRNLPNGKVEIEVEGNDTDVATFIDYCRVGPPRAVIVSISAHSQPIVGYTEFRVR